MNMSSMSGMENERLRMGVSGPSPKNGFGGLPADRGSQGNYR